MTTNEGLFLAGPVRAHAVLIGNEWHAHDAAATIRIGHGTADGSRNQCFQFIHALAEALMSADIGNVAGRAWDNVKRELDTICADWASGGSTSVATATFVFFLKQPLFALLRGHLAGDALALARISWAASILVDQLGPHTLGAFQKAQDLIAIRQCEALLESLTPVINLWDGVIALPLIGTLDGVRAQVLMESMLDKIVSNGAYAVIIDITGVPTVDALVAQHLLNIVSAARLMSADCILSGIRPQIAQTIVHLGLEPETVSTKAALADAPATAIERAGVNT